MTPTRSPRGHLQSIIRKVSVPARDRDEAAVVRYLRSPAFAVAYAGLIEEPSLIWRAFGAIERARVKCRQKPVKLTPLTDQPIRGRMKWKSNPESVAKFIALALKEPDNERLARQTGLTEGSVKIARRRFVQALPATPSPQGRPAWPSMRAMEQAA